MHSFERLKNGIEQVPAGVAWYLADIGVAMGRQQLYSAQSPQRLERLLESALVESAVSSNRIEGVEVEGSRVGTLVFGSSPYRDRAEEELRGYRDALRWIHDDWRGIEVNQKTVLELHRLTRGDIWDAGKLKERDSDIIQRYPDGRERIRFRTVPASSTEQALNQLLELNNICVQEQWVPPLLSTCLFNFDFLCIHPFRDGNGRVSRLLFLLQCYRSGLEVGRYISLERLIEQNKERYYESLEQSSQKWHEAAHDFWPYASYLLSIVKLAYREFELRLGATTEHRGDKTELLVRTINSFPGTFSVSELKQLCSGVSPDMIRKVLKDLQAAGQVECLGRGVAARWRKRT
jgi:Fic family protein